MVKDNLQKIKSQVKQLADFTANEFRSTPIRGRRNYSIAAAAGDPGLMQQPQPPLNSLQQLQVQKIASTNSAQQLIDSQYLHLLPKEADKGSTGREESFRIRPQTIAKPDESTPSPTYHPTPAAAANHSRSIPIRGRNPSGADHGARLAQQQPPRDHQHYEQLVSPPKMTSSIDFKKIYAGGDDAPELIGGPAMATTGDRQSMQLAEIMDSIETYKANQKRIQDLVQRQ